MILKILRAVFYVPLCIIAGAIAGCGVSALLSHMITMNGSLLLNTCFVSGALAGGLFAILTLRSNRFRSFCSGVGATYLWVGLILAVNGRNLARHESGWDKLGPDLLALAGECAAVVGLLLLVLALLDRWLRRN